MSVLGILLFFLILLARVIVHEFGHFIAAKWVGMRVDEFAFGFPPRLWSKKKGETTYAINALPLGGYVSIWGENGSEEDNAKDGAKHSPRAFGNRPKWQQFIVLVAGVFMNMVLAFVIFVGLSLGDVPMNTSDPVYGSRVENAHIVVTGASPNSPAYLAGIVPNSVLTKIVSGGQAASLTNADAVVKFVIAHQNDAFRISFIKPDGTQGETTVAAVYGLVPERKSLGIELDTVGTLDATFWESIKIGSQVTYQMTRMTFEGLGTLVSSFKEGDALDQVTGPIGLVQIISSQTVYGSRAVLSLVAIISINLAIFNALPIPALDGGRIVVVALEAISRRRIPFKYYSWANIIGFSALMLFVIVVSIHDVMRIVHMYFI